MGQTVSSFCNSARRVIQDSFNIGRLAHFLGGDEPAGRSRDARFTDVGEAVHSFRAGTRRSARTSRNTPDTATNTISAMGMLNVQRPIALPRARDRAVMKRRSPAVHSRVYARARLSAHGHIRNACHEAVQGRCPQSSYVGMRGWRERNSVLTSESGFPLQIVRAGLQRCLQDLQVILN